MDEIGLLEGVLAGTEEVIAGVGEHQWELPTPCPEYDVGVLVDHILGWARVFAAGANGRSFEGDPSAHRRGDDPAGEFQAIAAEMVAGWREHGFDRQVPLVGAEPPGVVAFNMTVMEYVTHGWDLARATGQPFPWSEDLATATLVRAEATLPPEYRGDGMSFGHPVPVDAGAPAVDRLAGFMGRTP